MKFPKIHPHTHPNPLNVGTTAKCRDTACRVS